MTPKQIDKKARQLYYRKRLIETAEGLEEAIKTFMAVEGTNEIQTSKFRIKLVEGGLAITVKPATGPNQLTFHFAENITESKI